MTIADHLIHGDHYDLYLMVIHVWQNPPPPPPHPYPNSLYAYYYYRLFSSFPPFQITEFYVCFTCYYGEMRDVTLLSMKNKYVQNCRFVHHAKFHCIMTTLNKLFKIEFERWGGKLEKNPIIIHGSLHEIWHP